jgi:hypothetical protein
MKRRKRRKKEKTLDTKAYTLNENVSFHVRLTGEADFSLTEAVAKLCAVDI